MRIGIVGLPNAGKSTLFNALTSGGAETASYAFTTIEPNVAVAAVPDERLEALADTLGASELVPATIYFHDIAGLVRGASQGEGLGNQFLGAIRETDAICHVVRTHGAGGVPHPDGSVDAVRDIETIETELLLSDLEQAERRLERLVKQARSGDPESVAEHGWLERVVEALQRGEPVRSVPAPSAAPQAQLRLHALTSKPVLFVANVEEGSVEVPDEIAAHAASHEAAAVAVSARIEADLAELDPAERDAMRDELGVGESGLVRLVRAAYDLLGLITFFTADRDSEACARSLHRGETALDAAEEVHTDFRAGFIKAEVIGWQDLVEAGGYVPARDRGLLRIEGRDYVVGDGDVITIRT